MAAKIAAVFLLCIHIAKAQSNYKIDHIGSEEGLSSQLCNHLAEDKYGNLWISTFLGIQKYNGHEVIKFPAEVRKGDPSDNISDICVDSKSNLWVIQGEATTQDIDKYWSLFYRNSNINIINPLTNSVSSFRDYINPERDISKNIVKVFQGGEILYLCTADNQIYSYTDSLKLFLTRQNIETIMAISDKGEITYFEEGSIYIKDAQGNIQQELNFREIDNYDAVLASETGKIFLIKEQKHEVRIDEYVQNQIRQLITTDRNIFNDVDLKFSTIERINNDQVLINGHLFQKNENNQFSKLDLTASSLINDYLVSQAGLGYAATNKGVFISNFKELRFEKLAQHNEELNSARALFISEDIIAHKVHNYELITNTSDKYNLDFLNDHDLGYMAFGHYQDPINENHLWSVGFLHKYIRRIDFEKQEVTHFETSPLKQESLNTILRSSYSSKLYISSESGLLLFNEQNNIFEHLPLAFDGKEISLTNHIIERNNEIWIASSHGVVQINEQEKTTKLAPIFSDTESYTIQFIHEDLIDSNIVWLGTRMGGVAKWNTANNDIEIINTDNGLSNNDVHAIIEDGMGRLWISTNQYLNCFDKNNSRISVFTEQDGLNNAEFNKHGYFFDRNKNQIYFGGLNGYNYFNPDSISTDEETNKINVRISNAHKIQSDGSSENIFLETAANNLIKLYEKDVSLELELSTNFLFENNKTQYSYRIPQLENKWKTQTSKDLKLNRLPYGKYTLELIADLNKPALTSNIFTVDVEIIKPFTKSLLFYLLLLVGLITLIWWVFQFYSKQLKERNEKLEATVALRTNELTEVINSKNEIFAILAHDLRNPISSLSNLTDKIKFLAKHNRVDELGLLAEQTNSRITALSDNLNNILIWALKEKNMLTPNAKKIALLPELNKILQIYANEIAEKSLVIHIPKDEHYEVFLDISFLQTILRNLVHNAIKFSYPNGEISFDISREPKGKLALSIKDQGIGLDLKENDRNDQDREIWMKGKGSGLGLQITKELSIKSNIELNIESQKGKGTVAILSMPISG